MDKWRETVDFVRLEMLLANCGSEWVKKSVSTLKLKQGHKVCLSYIVSLFNVSLRFFLQSTSAPKNENL